MTRHKLLHIVRSPIVVSAISFVFLMIIVISTLLLNQQRYQQQLKTDTFEQLSKVRKQLETGINDNFYLSRGLTALIAARPELDLSLVHSIAEETLNTENDIINIGIAPNNILAFVHPLEGNEKALGLNYENNPQQWPIVKKAIANKKTIIAGPVNLVQGGHAFICRTPIFIKTKDTPEKTTYWGLVSIVIDQEKLLTRAGFSDPDRPILITLKGTDGLGVQGDFIAGDQDVLSRQPLTQEVVIPGGSWLLAGIPLAGWQQKSPYFTMILISGIVLALLGSLLVFFWQRHEMIIQLQTQQALAQAQIYSKELADNKNFLNAILEHIPNIIFVKDAQTLRFVHFNKAGEILIGIKREQLLGKDDYALFKPQDADYFTGIDKDVINHKKLIDIPEEILETEDGKRKTLHTQKIPLLNAAGEVTHVISIAEDITEIVQAEKEKTELTKQLQQAQKMEAIGLMAGGVAHDLNNILAALTGYPELLLKKISEDSDLRPSLEIIRDSGKRAAAVVADLLLVAKGMASSKTPLLLNTIISEYLESPEFKKIQKTYPEVIVKTDLDKSLAQITASSIHLKKIIMNLVNNAAEAIENVGIITLQTMNILINEEDPGEEAIPAGNYVLLSISDSGTGISDQDLSHIFDPFYSKKALGRTGTGLGLAIVWNSIQDHNGYIKVNSSKEGTTFRLYFPATAINHEPLQSSSEDINFNGHGEHIIVIDDEPHIRDLARQMLQECGYKVTTLCNGEQAVEFLRYNDADLLLLDMLMPPGLNGYQTYAKIKSFKPHQRAVIASGFSDSDDVKATLAAGAYSFIFKPYSLEQLANEIQQALRAEI